MMMIQIESVVCHRKNMPINVKTFAAQPMYDMRRLEFFLFHIFNKKNKQNI